MTQTPRGTMRALTLTLGGLLAVTFTAMAQIGGVGQRGAGGLGAGQGTRQYLNNTQIGDALIEVDPETRSIIIVTDDETNDSIQSVVTSLDRPKPQVLINVVFLEITHRNDLDVGIDGSFSFTQKGDTATVGSIFDVGAASSPGGFYRILGDNIDVTMRALAEKGKLEVLSRPSILARNNQEAVITIGQEVPFIRDTRILQDGQQLNTVEYEDIGIILRVTPFITSDGLVEMIIAPEISTLTDETVPISAGVRAPVFAKRSAETVVVTPNGKTVIIGGLIEDNKIESVRKVPLLGDIPLLGMAFRRKVKEDTKTELLIFLTPQIIMQPEELTAVSALERQKINMAETVFSEKQMNRYVNGMSQEELRDYIQGLQTLLEEPAPTP